MKINPKRILDFLSMISDLDGAEGVTEEDVQDALIDFSKEESV